MPEEERSRILLLLPAPTTLAQFLLLNDVVSEFVEFCGGATVSSTFPSVFDGWWVDQAQNPPVNDANVLIFGDALQERNAPALVTYLERLKRDCQHVFAQDIVWITVHGVVRITTGDYVR